MLISLVWGGGWQEGGVKEEVLLPPPLPAAGDESGDGISHDAAEEERSVILALYIHTTIDSHRHC